MDYKELIGRYRLYATKWENGEQLLLNGEMRIQDTLREAATAIETLLAERDAAVEDLRGLCWCCANGKKYENRLPWSKATTCEHMLELGVVARSGGKCKCQFWKWRGPQKGENHD